MPLSRVLARDRARLAWITLSILLVGVFAGALLPLSDAAARRSARSVIEAYSPVLAADIMASAGLGERMPNASLVELLAMYHRNLSSTEPPDTVSSYTGLLVLDFLVGYRIVNPGERVPEPSIYAPEPGGQMSLSGTPGGEWCFYTGVRAAAVAPLGPGGLEAAGLRLVEGRWPGPSSGGRVEVAVSTGLASALGLRPGSVFEPLPGLELEVTGLFAATMRGAVLGDYMGMPVMAYFVVDKESIGVLARLLEEGFREMAGSGERGVVEMAIVAGTEAPPGIERPCSLIPREGFLPGTAWLATIPSTNLTQAVGEAAEQAGEGLPGEALLITLYSANFLRVAANVAEDVVLEASSNPQLRDAIILEATRDFLSWLAEAGALTPEYAEASVGVGSPPGPGASGWAAGSTDGLLVAVTDNGLYEVVQAVSTPLMDPLSSFSLVIVALSTLVVGVSLARSTLEVVIGDLRRLVALLAARGAGRREMARSMAALLLVVAVASAAAGTLLGYLLGGGVRLSLLLSLILTLIVAFAAQRKASKLIATVEPVEAVRPLQAAARVERIRARASAFLVGLALTTLVVGVAGDPERLVEAAGRYGTGTAAIAVIVVILGFALSPVSPLILSYTASTLAASVERVFNALAEASSRLAGRLSWAAGSSSRRLRTRLSTGLTAPSLALGVALGSMLAASSLEALRPEAWDYYDALLGGGRWDPMAAAGLGTATAILAIVALISGAAGLLGLYLLLHSAYRHVEAEVVVAMARGASAGEARRLAYAMLAPISLHTLLAGVIGGLAFHLEVWAVARIAYFGTLTPPLLAAPPAPLAAGSLALIGLVMALPFIVAARGTGGSLASRLRRLMSG